MKRLIHIAAVVIFTLGQILPYRPAYAGDPVPNPVSPAESSSPTIAIDTATQSSDQEVAPTNTTEPTDTTQFLASMDATPLSAEEAPATFVLQGDVNGDLKVDSQDLTILFQAGKYETGEAATPEEGDLDGNGVFETSDLIILARNYGREVLHQMAFGDGTFVIEKQPDQEGNVKTFARVYPPTSEEPLVEFEIEEKFQTEVTEHNFNIMLTTITPKTTDGKSIQFNSYTQNGEPSVANYSVEEPVTSHLLGEELIRETEYGLRPVGESYAFQLLDDLLWDVTENRRTVQQVFYSTNDMGVSHISQISYYHRSGSSSGTVLQVLLPPQSREPWLTVLDSPSSVLFSGKVTDYSFTTEESTGLLTTLTATAEDGRKISVVITPAGIGVELREEEVVESKRFPKGLTRVTSFIVVGDGKGGQQVLPHQIRLLDSEGHDIQLTTNTYEQTTGELFAVYTRYSEVVDDHTELRLALTRTHVSTKDETAHLFINDNEFTSTLDLVPSSIRITSEIPSGLFETLSADLTSGGAILIDAFEPNGGIDVDLRDSTLFVAAVTAAF